MKSTGPGSMPLQRSAAPAVKADELLFVHFENPDLDRAQRFLTDFGLTVALRTGTDLFMRGAGSRPYIYRVSLGREPRFEGLGFSVKSMEDLQVLSKASGQPVRTSNAPGGGAIIELRDPDGASVQVLYGFARSEPLPLRQPIPHNAPNKIIRINDVQRPALEPPQVTKLGHLVLEATDFDASARWYMDMLGMIPSDVMCLADGTPVGAFMRLDRGTEPADHHTLFIATGFEFGVDHVAFEVVDLDAVEMGQQIHFASGYKHAWGVGRHLLGSQIFDYWRDPWGQKHEHYADGDLFDASRHAGYQLMDRSGLYQWGPDLPKDFIDTRLTFQRAWKILKIAFKDKARFRKMLALKKSIEVPGRPWQ